MTKFIIPHKFVAGTKAKAEEVNENFTALGNELDKKIENGQTVSINVEDATSPAQPVSKSQLDSVEDNLKADIETAHLQYCVHSGNCVNGWPTLFSISGSQVVPLVGGAYPELVLSHTGGKIVTRKSLNSINMSGYSDGVYNIFIPVSGDAYVLKNNVVYTVGEPLSKVEGDVWIHIGNNPLEVYIYKSGVWEPFNDVFVGSATISGYTLTAVTTMPYCFNGHNVTNLPIYKNMITGVSLPNWYQPIALAVDTLYVAEVDGYVCARVDGPSASVLVYVNGLLVATSGHYTSFHSVVTVEVPKGFSYRFGQSNGTWIYGYFIPCIGGNL